MNLAISNIAWPADKLADALAILQKHQIKGLEIAPGLLFDQELDPFVPSNAAQKKIHNLLADSGVELVSMQSLLFGVKNAALFGGETERRNFITGMNRAIGLAGNLGIQNIVFGSPKARIIPTDMNRDTAQNIAAQTMGELGDFAKTHGVKIAMEPCPAEYGTNFLNTMEQALQFCEHLNHPNITLNFDLGALHMNDQFAGMSALMTRALAHISHIHMSEPNLAAAPANVNQARELAKLVAQTKYQQWVSIEMLHQPETGSALEQVDICLGKTQKAFTGITFADEFGS